MTTVIVGSSTARTGTTRKSMRRLLAKRVGPFSVLSTTSTASNVNSMTFSALVDSGASATSFGQGWFYVTSGTLTDEQRRAANSALNTTTGAISVTVSFGSIPGSGVEVEYLGRLPAKNDGFGVDGLNDCIAQALREYWFQDLVSMTGTTGTTAYSLSSYDSWLKTVDRIIDVYGPAPNSGDLPTRYSGRWNFRHDGEAPVLELPGAPYVTGDTFYLRVLRPGNSRLKQSGTWADNTDPMAEMTSDSDEFIPPPQDILQGGLLFAYRQLQEIGKGQTEISFWQRRADEQEKVWATVKRKFAPSDKQSRRPMLALLGGNDWLGVT